MKNLIPYALIFVVIFTTLTSLLFINPNDEIVFSNPYPNKLHYVNKSTMSFEAERHFCYPLGNVYENVNVHRTIENGLVIQLTDDFVPRFPPKQSTIDLSYIPDDMTEEDVECYVLTLEIEIPENIHYGRYVYKASLGIENKFFDESILEMSEIHFVYEDPNNPKYSTKDKRYPERLKRAVKVNGANKTLKIYEKDVDKEG